MLHLASRIVPVIRKYSMGWEDAFLDEADADADGSNGERPGFWDGRSLGEEPAVSRILGDLGSCFLLDFVVASLISALEPQAFCLGSAR